MPARN